MLRRSCNAAVAVLLVLLTLAVGAGSAAAAPVAGPLAAAAVAGLPDGVPPAALRAEPARPTPRGWPFGSAFPRTSGTGRLSGGAAFWSDFLYDDHGARGVPGSTGVATLAPTTGTYSYAATGALGNGADVFGSAVGVDATSSWWRVDWTTLADPSVPLAVWALDSDGDAATGVPAVGAGTGVSAAGLDKTLAVSSTGAVLTDLVHGTVTHLPTTVDAGSFVVRVPLSVLPLAGTSRVRLVSAVADGTSAAAVGPQQGALPGQPAVYDVSYDPMVTEPLAPGTVPGVGADNWSETQQATSLASGDITPFSTTVDWSTLRARRSTPEPAPTGLSTRWYLAGKIATGGVVKPATTSIDPAFLSSPQPYVVDVPPGLPAHPAVTLLLHSSNSAHTQYATTAPKTLAQLCDGRRSICVTPLARGPSTWYFDASEVDLWQVWRQVALAYGTDPDRTVVGGYSMGGWATYRLALTYPSVFAEALSLEGRVNCGVGLDGGTNGVQQGGRCSSGDGDTQAFVTGARTVPWVIAHSTTDELVPYPTVLSQVQAFQAAGLRNRFETYTGQDHVSFALADAFTTEVAALHGTPLRSADVGQLDLHWWSDLTDTAQGLGPSSDQWVRSVVPRRRAAGLAAGFSAVDHALSLPSVTASTASSVDTSAVPSPAVVQQTTWTPAAASPVSRVLDVTLTDLAAFGVDVRRARLPTGTAHVTTDGPARLRLVGLPAGSVVSGPSGRVAVTRGEADVALAGSGTVTWRSSGATHAAASGPQLPTTGLSQSAGLLALLVLGGSGAVRRAAQASAARR